jgi:hypothetical protein
MPSRPIISFEALEAWSYPNVRHYTYSYISDEEVSSLLDDDSLAYSELDESWHLSTDNYSPKADNPIHPRRIAKLLFCLRAGEGFPPVKIVAEDDARDSFGFCITEGHHRLRALQYEMILNFAALVCGCEEAIEELLGEIAPSGLDLSSQ